MCACVCGQRIAKPLQSTSIWGLSCTPFYFKRYSSKLNLRWSHFTLANDWIRPLPPPLHFHTQYIHSFIWCPNVNKPIVQTNAREWVGQKTNKQFERLIPIAGCVCVCSASFRFAEFNTKISSFRVNQLFLAWNFACVHMHGHVWHPIMSSSTKH